MKLDRKSSLYIDLLRIVAAGYVFLYHLFSKQPHRPPGLQPDRFFESLGLNDLLAHYHVIIFFVLSGFLIAKTLQRSNQNFTDFILRRIGRLYSVMIPALVCCYLVMFVLTVTGLLSAAKIEGSSNLLPRLFLALTFQHQTWSLMATPPFGAPFWSIANEFAYYLLFGLLVLLRGTWRKLIAFTLVALLFGPKVVVLFPCWIVGAVAYHFLDRNSRLPVVAAWPVWLLTAAVLLAITTHQWAIPIAPDYETDLLGTRPFFSYNYRADYLYSILVGINLVAFVSIAPRLRLAGSASLKNRIDRVIRATSNCTFTLYLFHAPLLALIVYLFPVERGNPLHLYLVIGTVLLLVYLIARQTEWRTERWRELTYRAYHAITSQIKRRLPSAV